MKVTNFSTLFRVGVKILSGNGKKITPRLFFVKKVLKNRERGENSAGKGFLLIEHGLSIRRSKPKNNQLLETYCQHLTLHSKQ